MSDKAKKLEGVKQEVRSVLLSHPKDMTIPTLLSDYRSIVGQSLPFTEFGYSSPDEFLRSIPNVVSMNWSKKYNTYLLRAVADETTKHIEKLVSKQKNSRSARTSHRMTTGPPRFSNINTNKSSSRPYLSAHVKSEIYAVVKDYRNGLSLPNFLTAFRKKYGKELVYRCFGYYTLEDCLNSIPEVLLRCEGNEMRVYPIIEKTTQEPPNTFYQDSSGLPNSNAHYVKENNSANVSVTENASGTVFNGNLARNKTINSLDDFSSPDEHSDNFGITPALKEQFKQIMKKNPQGIWVSRFPAAVQELTGHYLDHPALGYYNLIDLFSDFPEIFRIEVFNDCKDDWLLFDATSPVENIKPKEGSKPKTSFCTKTSKDLYSVVKDIRLLLQANHEGIGLNDFCGLYEANCGQQLDFSDLGFSSFPSFLDSIAKKVPLKIDYTRKEIKVFYKKEACSDSMGLCLELSSDIPADAVVGCTEFNLQNLPENLNPEQFFPVYLSAAFDPSHIYIQLPGEDTSVRLERLMDELESFYYEKESECYRMPKHYIISGMVCAAIWPGDGRWHRIRISSVPSGDSIVAFFVDYGTKERISSDNLRFIKKKFMELPAQAIRSHLCRLKPSHGDQWDTAAKDFILASFGMQPLMACLTQAPVSGDSLPLVLCDVSGDNDIFLNDILVSKDYAKYATDEDHENEKEIPDEHSYIGAEEITFPVNYQKSQLLSTTQQIPLLPERQTENPLRMSMINTASMKNYEQVQNPSNPVRDSNDFKNSNFVSAHTSVINELQSGNTNEHTPKPMNEFFASQPTANMPVPNFSSSTPGFCQTAPYNVSHGSDSDVFESDEEIDDDDNPEVNSISKRYVKRINLGDGYNHIHMIVMNDTPYMCSGDITYLLWNHDDPDFVRRKLRKKEIFIPNTTVKEVGYEQLFYQLDRFQVKGVKTEVNGNHYITLFPYKNVVDILNIFGHPSVTIRDIIDNELFCFNPLDSFWKTISEEEFEGNLLTERNNENEQRVSLYELKASLQALKFRKQTLKNKLYSTSKNPDLCREIEETEVHCVKTERQIKELQLKIISHQREKAYD